MELELWSSIKNSNSADDFRAYLGRYPHGTFAEIARNRVETLAQPSGAGRAAGDAGTGETSNKATQDALGLTPDDWKQVQRRLVKFGVRALDGSGESTRSSLKSWQANRGYPVSGYLNRPQYEALLREEPAPATTTTSASRSTQQPQQQRPRRNETDDKSSAEKVSPDQVMKGFGQGVQFMQMLKGR
jgi:putative peptidoglycan binding protein